MAVDSWGSIAVGFLLPVGKPACGRLPSSTPFETLPENRMMRPSDEESAISWVRWLTERGGRPDTQEVEMTDANTNREPIKETGIVATLVERHPRTTLSLIMLFAALGLGFILYSLWGDGNLLDKLSRVEYARGVITFIFAVGTFVIAVTVAVAGLLGGPEAADKFNRSKEVFTVLVGILGTILGFYFGNETSAEAQPGEEPIAVESWSIEPVTGEGGETVLDTEAKVRGGTPPYAYSLTFEPALIERVRDEPTDGTIAERIPVPEEARGQEIQATLSVGDGSGARATETKPVPLAAEPP
jgi:hypothetical protein